MLRGEAGGDVLWGGAGNDTLEGGLGNDLYLIGRDGGRDTLIDYDPAVGNVDTVRFIDMRADEATAMRKVGYDLEVFFAETQFVLKNHFMGAGWQVEKFEFADGFACDSREFIELVGSVL